MTQLGFYFDSSACSGCKACQAACKDKNNLPVGLLWRRVYEVTGGSWTRSGATWTSDVLAYNLSIACNHCEKPICVEVCPTQAMHRRADGIVVVVRDKCVGCQYCSWACPYDAPQYDRTHGHMTKCDFCVDNLAAGLPPACVAACPLRVLDFGEMKTLEAKHGSSSSGHPLPDESLTQPALIIKPHQAMGLEPATESRALRAVDLASTGVDAASSAQADERRNVRQQRFQSLALGNAEEVRAVDHTSERSLMVFTLLTQLAVGATWFLSLLQIFRPLALGVVSIVMLAGLLASLLHLGTPRNAWRAIRNVRTSWLSREVLCAMLFAASLVGLTIIGGAGAWLADVIGLALIVSMAQVYQLRTVPAWNHWTTTASFFGTTLLLGGVLCGALIGGGPWLALGSIGLIGVRQAIGPSEPRVTWLHVLIVLSLLLTLISPIGWWLALVLSLIAEVLARRAFYAARSELGAWRFSP